MAKDNKADVGDAKLNLTPCIDMVFQLMIFFMVVSDITPVLEDVQLTRASQADTNKENITERAIIVNVTMKGDIKIMGTKLEGKALEDRLAAEAAVAGLEDNPKSPGKKISKLWVTIRGDQNVAYEKIQNVFEACAKNGIWRTRIAAIKEEYE